MKQLLSHIVAATAGLWLASLFIAGVMAKVYRDSALFGFPVSSQWEMLAIWGVTLGLLNYLAWRFLLTLDLPLEPLSTLVLALAACCAFLWTLDSIFAELYIPFYIPLVYTGLIIWGLNLAIKKILIHD